MTRNEMISECVKLAAVAGPSVSIIRAVYILGDGERACFWAREVASLEADILSQMLRDALPSDIIADRFARVIYVRDLLADKPALRRYEQALRVFWKETLRVNSNVGSGLQGTAQGLLVCALLLDKAELANDASSSLPEGPWRDLARAWAEDDRTLMTQLERRLADHIQVEESSGNLSIVSDTWTYVLLDRIRRRRDETMPMNQESVRGT